jgi:hypothetical protein
MSADPPRRSQLSSSRSRVHGDGLADDEAIADKFADGLAGIGVRDFVDFIGIEPNFALAATDYGSSEALLRPEIDPVVSLELAEIEKGGKRHEL